jgi:hypothetical protein
LRILAKTCKCQKWVKIFPYSIWYLNKMDRKTEHFGAFPLPPGFLPDAGPAAMAVAPPGRGGAIRAMMRE